VSKSKIKPYTKDTCHGTKKEESKMATRYLDQEIKEKPTADDYAVARNEVAQILKGKSIPSDWIAVFKFAYLQGVKDGRSGTVVQFTKIEKANTQTNKGATKTTMATKPQPKTTSNDTVTATDWANLQARLEELNEKVQKQIDGTSCSTTIRRFCWQTLSGKLSRSQAA
jgi:hypothetical protein